MCIVCNPYVGGQAWVSCPDLDFSEFLCPGCEKHYATALACDKQLKPYQRQILNGLVTGKFIEFSTHYFQWVSAFLLINKAKSWAELLDSEGNTKKYSNIDAVLNLRDAGHLVSIETNLVKFPKLHGTDLVMTHHLNPNKVRAMVRSQQKHDG